MNAVRVSAVCLLCAGLVIGCEQSPPTAVPQVGPSFNFSNGPANPGIVLRTDRNDFFFFVDDKSLLVAFGSTGDGPFPCATSTVLTPGDLQRIVRDPSSGTDPDAFPELRLFVADELFMFVYDWTGMPNPFTCDFILNGPRIAEGTARLVNTDNDFFAFLRDDAPRTNSFGWQAHGTLQDLLNGGQVRFSGHVRIAFRPAEPDDEVLVVQDKVTLVPDPRE